MTTEADEVRSLRRGLRDLVALTTLPAIWAGQQPRAIAESLSEVLDTTLRLDLVYIHFNGRPEQVPLELARADQRLLPEERAREVGKRLAPWLKGDDTGLVEAVAGPLNGGSLQLAVIPIGHNGNGGFVAAGVRSSESFTELDRLLLSVAVNQAAIALQQAQLLTDLRSANALKDSLLVREQSARVEAEEANETRLTFLGMISHELRTPLASIKGFASTLLAEDVTYEPESQRDFLQIIEDEADKLTELVEQLLDLSRLQAGVMRIRPERVTLRAVIDSARPQLQMLAKEHVLLYDVGDGKAVVAVDTGRIVQVLANLIHNAVKYSAPQTRISVIARPRAQELQVDVCDEGIGIPVEERPKLFQAFQQVERRSSAQKGAGLGLAICKGLVEAHGGKIWIGDQLPPGTTVSFTLPLATADNALPVE